MIKRLRLQFIGANMLITLLVLLLLFASLTRYMHRGMVTERTDMLQRIAAGPTVKYQPGDMEGGNSYLSYFTLEHGPNGELRASGDQLYDLSDTEQLKGLYERVSQLTEDNGVLKDMGLRYARVITPRGWRMVFSDTSVEKATDRYLLRVSLLSGLVAVSVFFGLSFLFSLWAVNPVDLAWRQQKQFVADASHELKTPLAVIVSNAELLQQPGYTDAQRKKFSDSILVMSRQMHHLVDSLLNLARLDSLNEDVALQDLDLSALTEDCILPFEPLYFEQGLTLESEIAPGLHVQGNERALRQCVDILLDNAQKYSEPGVVRLRLRPVGRMAELTVSNPSPELSKSECRAVFRRFYRRDEARTVSGSYGLGLPIAEGIVTRHGGKITCSWASGEIRFTVTLPLG